MILLSTAHASAWLLQAAATLPDTIVSRQIIQRGWFDQTTYVAGGFLTLLLLLLAILVIPTAWYLRLRLGTLTRAVEGLRADIGPAMEQTRRVMENADAISTTVRQEVERLSETAAHLDDHFREIVDIAGERVRDFDTLLGAVHEEAEGIFLTSASAARGIRAGFRALGRHRARKSRQDALRAARAAADLDERELLPDEAEAAEPRPREPRLRRRRGA